MIPRSGPHLQANSLLWPTGSSLFSLWTRHNLRPFTTDEANGARMRPKTGYVDLGLLANISDVSSTYY
jgi:hypothetical protein